MSERRTIRRTKHKRGLLFRGLKRRFEKIKEKWKRDKKLKMKKDKDK